MSHPVQYIEGITPEQTARHICRMAIAALRQHRFLLQARAIVRWVVTVNYLKFAAGQSELAAVWNWITTHLRYTSDPVGVELVQGPLAIMDQVAEYGRATEDCDGFAVLSMALLMALGHQCRVVIVGIGSLSGYQHVFIEVLRPRVGWMVFDPSLETKRRNLLMMNKTGAVRRFHPDDLEEDENEDFEP